MTTHRLQADLLVDRPIDEVFAFFSRPENLARITPPGIRFDLQTSDTAMRDGLEVDYRVRPLFWIPVGWRSKIADYDPPHGFRDIQLKGPYRSWDHRHNFVAEGDQTRISDVVDYSLPLGPLGELAHAAVVRGQLDEIFRHRARTIHSIFAPPGRNENPLTVAVAGGSGFVGGGIAAEPSRAAIASWSSLAGESPRADRYRTASRSGTPTRQVTTAWSKPWRVSMRWSSPSPSKTHQWSRPRAGRPSCRSTPPAQSTSSVPPGGRASGGSFYLSGAGAAADARQQWFRAKWRAEQAVRGSGLAWTILRPTWIYGPGDASLNRSSASPGSSRSCR